MKKIVKNRFALDKDPCIYVLTINLEVNFN